MEKYINEATEHFRRLLLEQFERSERMENQRNQKDYASLEKIVIGIIGGDGIGPIIVNEAERVLNVLLDTEIKMGKIELRTIEGLTIENREQSKKSVPKDVLEEIKACDVILKGPTTTPKGGTMESANVTLRRELDLFANIRPIEVPEENIDWIFFRENTEGEYVLGSQGIEIPGILSMDFKVTTKEGTERIARAAFDYAKQNGKHNVAIITKANIMKKTDGDFSRICHQVGEEYPNIEVQDWYIDIMAANLVNKDIRNQYQVFVLPNLYGDIITDEAAQIQGGVGTAGSSNVGSKYAMFEAIHGSAPRLVQQGLGEYANPLSIFKACELMLRHIGYVDKANKIQRAVEKSNKLANNEKANGTAEGITCSKFTDFFIKLLK